MTKKGDYKMKASNTKMKYEPSVVDIIYFKVTDILTASDGAGEGGYEDEL